MASGTTDITLTSTSWTDMTNMVITMTTSGGSVLVNFTSSLHTQTSSTNAEVGLFVDGVYNFSVRLGQPSNHVDIAGISRLVTGLSAASHTFRIRWRILSSSGTVNQSAATWGQGRTMSVVDLGL